MRIHDPARDAEERAHALIRSAWPSLVDLGLTKLEQHDPSHVTFCTTIADAIAFADIVLENAPERREIKKKIMAEIDAATPPDKVILSSTGGIPATELQALCKHPERVLVFHPLNPTHLVPLLEIVPGKKTSEAATECAIRFARYLGKYPIVLRVEIVGHMTNRLQFALVREAVRCLIEGVASAREIDAAVRYGLAPRWMLMGGMQTLNLAGGAAGMKGILEHAGDAIEQWWKPGEDLHLTKEIREALVRAGAELSSDCAIEDWMAWRDEQLVPLLRLQSEGSSREPGKERGLPS